MQSIANPDKYTMSTTGSFNADVSHTGDGITLEDALTIQKELLFRELYMSNKIGNAQKYYQIM